jgi:phosphoribosylformylglycinamidine synthase
MTMIARVDVTLRPGVADARGEALRAEVLALGIPGIEAVSVSDLYFVEGELGDDDLELLTERLLVDPVLEQARWRWLDPPDEQGQGPGRGQWAVEVVLRPGVTDSVADSLVHGGTMLGCKGLRRAASGQRYLLRGELDPAQVQRLARTLLANEVVNAYAIDQPVAPPLVQRSEEARPPESIPLSEASDAELERISSERRLSLNLAEMQAIRGYYRQEGREPTDLELEMLAQTWSEHCVHKTFRARINYSEKDPDGQPVAGSRQTVDSLLDSYIRAATEHAARPWVRSAFVDNAGIVEFDDRLDLAFKVETHNHPSALEPFGGANTGIGGVVRDVMGVSARPIANTDVLCFGPQDLPHEALPPGVRHPAYIAAGVVSGIEDYGNKMGIPTVNGAILYDEGYTQNPLIYCGCLGVLPRGSHPTEPRAGDLVVSIGGRTGRDGLRGATFSSMEMTHETGQVAGSAVQIGNPITEKQALDVLMVARAEGLYNAVTDCGAGGFSSAVGEMGSELGAEVHLERVPLKYPGLSPWEVWLSEAQERMVLAVPPQNWPRLQEICAGEDVEATAIGHFTGDGQIRVLNHGREVGRLSTRFLDGGLPRREMQACWQRPRLTEPPPEQRPDLGQRLLELLAAPDIRSKEQVIRRYDHEVQGGTVGRPLCGLVNAGPADAAVLVPLEAHQAHDPQPGSGPLRGLALSVGICPRLGAIDPLAMAWAAVDEALRNCVAGGGDPDRTALLDNFCWGNPNLPDRLGTLVRAARGCHEAACAHRAPFVSGKDSLNNEYAGPDGRKRAIPGTLLVSALGIVPDVRRVPGTALKTEGNLLYMVGLTRDELGGSAYHRLRGALGNGVPRPCQESPRALRAVHRAMMDGLLSACHDCSEGGVLVAAAEMALAGRRGLELRLGHLPREPDLQRPEALAFSESAGRLLLEVAPDRAAELERRLSGLASARVGQVLEGGGALRVLGLDGGLELELPVSELEQAWRGSAS